MKRTCSLSGAVALLAVIVAAQEQRVPLAISTGELPEAVLRSNYNFQLKSTGGIEPVRWTIERGSLPPGVSLEEGSGTLSGVPTTMGRFDLVVAVTDSSAPRQKQQRGLTLLVVPGLRVSWKQPPQISGGRIYGSVDLESHLPEDADLTFIVMAVNEIGKAFVLGYQRLNLQAGPEPLELQFGSTLPAGTYIVHVDAVAESPARGEIYRSRLQTSAPLQIASTP